MKSEHCPIFEQISKSFKLKSCLCPNAARRDENGKVISYCPKTRKDCLVLADIKADEQSSLVEESDVFPAQERLIRAWIEKEGLKPTVLLQTPRPKN